MRRQKLQLHLKQSEQKESDNKIDQKPPDEKIDGEDVFVPVVIRPGHIRFEPLEEGPTVTLCLITYIQNCRTFCIPCKSDNLFVVDAGEVFERNQVSLVYLPLLTIPVFAAHTYVLIITLCSCRYV